MLIIDLYAFVYISTFNDKTSEIKRSHAKHLREFLPEFGGY